MTTSASERSLSIIMPAKNESQALAGLLPALREEFPTAEIIVVDDGSTDTTRDVVRSCGGLCISHPYSRGNGSAIKTGARAASGDVLAFMDADGQHTVYDLKSVLKTFHEGYDMAVGARGAHSQASALRGLGNWLYNRLASWMVEQPVKDLTSGLRVVDAAAFRKFLYLLPNGFSYPTTITMAFFRAGYGVAYTPIVAQPRIGKSHLSVLRDGFRFLMIIFKIGTLYSPLKLFTPLSLMFFALGLGNYIHTYVARHEFTNMSALLLVTSVLVFLIGLVSEQLTTLTYQEAPSAETRAEEAPVLRRHVVR